MGFRVSGLRFEIREFLGYLQTKGGSTGEGHWSLLRLLSCLTLCRDQGTALRLLVSEIGCEGAIETLYPHQTKLNPQKTKNGPRKAVLLAPYTLSH